MNEKLRIGFIPLVDATALLVAVDAGFTATEGLDVELIREVSWSNVRDKLNIGLFDAAHLLSPVAIASSLGIGHVRVPLVVPFNLGINGNAITVSPWLFSALSDATDGDLTDPKVSARALSRIVSERKARGLEPLNFGMTFPFSHHNYQLRYWMAAGGIDPDEDVVMLYLTGSSTPAHALAAVNPPLELAALSPQGLRQLLDAAGIRWSIIVVSTCEAGTWVDALQDDETAVIASSSADVNGSDCAGGIRPSAFGDVFFGSAMRQSDDLEHAVDVARKELAERKAPRPVMSIGASIADRLKSLRRKGSGKVVAAR